MSVDRSTLVFFDTSCLIAAARSPDGGSGFVLSLCRRGLLRAAVSQPVLLEAETNLRHKLPPEVLTAHRVQMAETPMAIAPVPPLAMRRRLQQIVNEKDDHVLAAALIVGARFLLTLDRALANEVNQGGLPIRAISPGEFIVEELIDHPDISRLRE